MTVEIDDPAKGLEKRDAEGVPVVVRRLAAPNDYFSDACAHAEGALGYAMSVAFLAQSPESFRIVATGITGPSRATRGTLAAARSALASRVEPPPPGWTPTP